jgi:hypothetical protein
LRWGFGTLKLGDQLRARFAQVFEFKVVDLASA